MNKEKAETISSLRKKVKVQQLSTTDENDQQIRKRIEGIMKKYATPERNRNFVHESEKEAQWKFKDANNKDLADIHH